MRTVWILEPTDPVARWTFAPLRYHWPAILAKHRVLLRFFRPADLEATRQLMDSADDGRCDILFVATQWQDSLEETTRIFESFARRTARPKLVFFDTTDPTSSPFFGLLPFVDLFVKKQFMQPLSRYADPLSGGNICADYFAREHGFELGQWSFGSSIPAGFEHRLMLGWNLGTARHLVEGLVRSHVRPPKPWSKRTIDVHYRVGAGEPERDWYSYHRTHFERRLAPASEHFRVVAASGKAARIPMDAFNAEMQSSRIAVSPFGWGEVTDRDFHVVNNLSLLVKPDMSHVRTEPDIYQPGETYVPVRWDGSDLVETCREYLQRPQEAQRIARNARRVYRDWFLRGGFLPRLGAILNAV